MLRRTFLKSFLTVQAAVATSGLMARPAFASDASGASGGGGGGSSASAASAPSPASAPSAASEASGPSDASGPSGPSEPSAPSGASDPSGPEGSLDGAEANSPSARRQLVSTVEQELQQDGLAPVSRSNLARTLRDFR